MFETVIESYKLLSIKDKRQEILSELKLMIAIFEKMCEDNGLEYRKVHSREVLDLDNGSEMEEDYLEATFVYVEYLKEVLGALFNKIQNG